LPILPFVNRRADAARGEQQGQPKHPEGMRVDVGDQPVAPAVDLAKSRIELLEGPYMGSVPKGVLILFQQLLGRHA
jgi:hypothetical protein